MNKELLDLYADYLISSLSQTTATGLSRLLGGALTHDAITNFLAESNFNSKDLWKLVKKDIREIESEKGVIIFDDTVQEKQYTDENEIICYHYDHTKGRSVKGVNILNCLYFNKDISLPLSYEIIHKEEEYVDTKDGKTKRRSSVSKNTMLRDMLKTIRQNQVKYGYVLTDTWFSSTENMVFIRKKSGEHFIMAVKSNRLVALSLEDKLQGRFLRTDSPKLRNDETISVYLKGLDFPVSLVKQRFINKDGSEGFRYLVCSDLSLTADEIKTIYKKRWKVEEFHKSIKSNTGLAKSPTRVLRTQSNHFFSSIYAFVKLERLKIVHKTNHFVLKSRLYINALKAAFKELKHLNSGLA